MQLKSKTVTFIAIACVLALHLLGAPPVAAQSNTAQERIQAQATNRPLASLAAAGAQARNRGPHANAPREVANFIGEGRPAPAFGKSTALKALQDSQGSGETTVSTGFYGADNNDNGAILGFLIAPPDTDGAVGPNHFVQMINLLTTVYDKNGNVTQGPFPSNAIWSGIGGNCQDYNQGDPVVLYDDGADRWLVSQFAFPDNLSSFSQCVAISQTGNPTGAYNRYEFSFNNIGFNDYPKHGIVTGSITMMANIFTPVGNNFYFGGTFLGVMDKDAMYSGQQASLIGFNIGTGEFGFVAGDLDGGGSAPPLFATAMSTNNAFDIWQIDVDWSTDNASVSQIASIPITPYDSDLCVAAREACIPQPNGAPKLEAITDRLMHRLQLRDFGSYRTMMASHTVDVGGGRAGIRWYELRETAGTWSLHQEGTFGPNDGQHRFMPSAAMNGAGDIGIGYLLSSTNTFVSTAAAGQSAASSGSGLLDAAEAICAAGTGVQTGTNRSGDYSATSVDPLNDKFWHTNEVFTTTGNFQWATFVCEFSVATGGGNTPPEASFTYDCTGLECSFTDTSTDGDGSVTAWSWNFGDGATSSAQNPTHTYAGSGTFTVTLTATDDDGANDNATQSVTVSAGNASPDASFTFTCNDLDCGFTDTSTDDGTIVNWSWTFGDGGGSPSQNPTHTYATGGTYSVTLTVTDNDGASDSATQIVTVSAGNTPPDASFTYSCNGLTCSFTDTSTDSDGTITGWFWSFGDRGTSSSQNPTHTYRRYRTYTVSLTVTDSDGAQDTFSQAVAVTQGNSPPNAAFTWNCNGLGCSFTDASTDSDGTITSWSWAFGDGGSSSAQNPSHAYGAAGTYTVVLTVTDDDGATDSAAQSVTVSIPNDPPNASFTFNCNELTCTFTDTSTDGDGNVTGWSWTFGDGGGASTQNPSHIYGSGGTYTVTLTVTDNDGANDSASQSVTVSAGNTPPNASFAFNCNDLDCGFTDTSTDGDGTITGWSWAFGDGGGSSAQNPSHSYAAAGTYTVTLTVTDNDGANDSASQNVTVTAPPSGDITLNATGWKRGSRLFARLYWSGATGGAVDIYRNGSKIVTTANDGYHLDYIGTTPGTYTYVVCEANSSVCSNPSTINF